MRHDSGMLEGIYRLDGAEAWLRATADQELGAFPIAESATQALALSIRGATIPPAADPPPPSYFMRSALLLLATMGLRTARAILVVVASGYEPEAHGLKRRLSEIHARAQAVVADDTGEHARQWLNGPPPSTPRKVAGKFGSMEIFDMYSVSEHADARGLHWWLMVPTEQEGQRGVLVQPHRRPRFSNAMLTEVAMECRDLIAVMEVVRDGKLVGLDELTCMIDEAIDEYYDAEPPVNSS